MIIEIKAAFPIAWDREYYTVDRTEKKMRAACTCCDNTGKVTIKGEQYECPRCHGNWRDKEIIGTSYVYSVAKWRLSRVTDNGNGKTLSFERTNTKTSGGWADTMEVRETDFHDMVKRDYGKQVTIYDDYKSAMDRVKMLNAAERERQKEAEGQAESQ